MQLGITISGVEDILQRFSRLPLGIQKKYLRAAVNKVTKPYVATVKSLVPRGPTGNLRRSVGVVTEAKRRGATQTAVLGFRRGDKGGENGNRSGYHAYWIERGVKTRTPRGTAFKVPIEMARRYPYLMGKVALIGGEDGGSVFFRQVNGFAGTGRFEAWAESTLPQIRNALQEELGSALKKAIAEQERRAIRKIG